MAKYAISKGIDRASILSEELSRFKKLLKGHEKILAAIGKL